MKIGAGNQRIEMHILAPVGESPPSKGDLRGRYPLQRGNLSVQIKGWRKNEGDRNRAF